MRTILALFAFTNAAWAECAPHEQTFMSCQIQNGAKILRVCFDETTAFYRFGLRGQVPELEISESIVTVEYRPWPGVGRSIAELVTFTNGDYRYDAFGGFERMFGDEEYEDIPHRSFGGVRVWKDDAVISEVICARETVDFAWGEGLWDAKHDLGVVWSHDASGWVQPPD